MNAKKRLLPALVLSVFLGAAAPAVQAQQGNPGAFSNVVVFGDSLSDAGYFRPFLTSLGLPASVVATLGRFTTNPGPVWSELVSQYYGVTPAASNASGFIFAQGGARVTLTPGVSTPPGVAERSVSTQINEYLARNGGAADPNALYAVWAGANDVFFNLGALQAGGITQAQLQANVLGAATAEIGQIARLQAAGARYIIAFGLPNIGAAPAFAGSTSAGSVTALSAGYNTTLFSGLASAGIRVIPVDVFSLGSEVAANPGAYGFTNTTGIACGPFPPITTTPNAFFCGPTNLVAPNADRTYLYADGVHPTTASQAIIAQFVESLIDGPMQYSLLAEAPLRTRASLVRALNDGVLAGRGAEVGKFSVFAAADGAGFDVDAGGGTPGLKSSLNSLAVGVTMRASESVVLGAAYGRSRLGASFGNEKGNFRTNENSVSLFGSVNLGGFYGTGVVSLADIEYNETQRKIVLGPVTRVATSNPEGSNVSSYFTAGYDFALGRFKVGPAVTLTTGNVDVNQFDEQGAGSANLRIGAQKRRSEVWGLGVRASADLGAWTPWLRITADKERRDEARLVTATPLSMATANSYDLPAYSGDSSFMTTTAGISGLVAPNVALSFAYFKVSNRSGIKEDGVAGSVSVKF